jgi:hypothetical protein
MMTPKAGHGLRAQQGVQYSLFGGIGRGGKQRLQLLLPWRLRQRLR